MVNPVTRVDSVNRITPESDANPAGTHLGWCHAGSDAGADGDHLLIQGDWSPSAPAGEASQPVLEFLEPTTGGANLADAGELADAGVEDAPLDAPPYLWSGDWETDQPRPQAGPDVFS